MPIRIGSKLRMWISSWKKIFLYFFLLQNHTGKSHQYFEGIMQIFKLKTPSALIFIYRYSFKSCMTSPDPDQFKAGELCLRVFSQSKPVSNNLIIFLAYLYLLRNEHLITFCSAYGNKLSAYTRYALTIESIKTTAKNPGSLLKHFLNGLK